jgi:hypothetical protein
MKSPNQVRDEVQALKHLATECPDDPLALASIAGQVNALLWVADFDVPDNGASETMPR